MGGDIDIVDNTMLVTKSKLSSANVSGHNDHRIAMTLIMASLLGDCRVNLDNIDCIDKSFPSFLKRLKK